MLARKMVPQKSKRVDLCDMMRYLRTLEMAKIGIVR
jgi:hypothetical protein